MGHPVKIFLVSCLLVIFLQDSLSAKILVYIPLPFYSHQAAYRPLFRELANRGHQITLITLNPMEPHENISQIDLSNAYGILEKKGFYEILNSGEGNIKVILKLIDMTPVVADSELRQPELKEFLNGSGKYDLVITEYYFTLGAAFAYKYNCPLIGVVSMDAHPNVHNIVGNPTHPILYPNFDLGYTGKLNFPQRFISTAYYFIWDIYLYFLYNKIDNVILKKYFSDDLPTIFELEKLVSVVFINSNPVFHKTRPLGAQTVNVGGGLHIEKPKPLPKDIKQYLDECPEGVIYFSLGSSLNASQLSQNFKSVLINTFAQLPYKILWKYENNDNETFEIPNNVLTRNWFPQQDILRHSNLKLFITQGGLQSLEEALFIGIPVLVIPFFGDQLLNAHKVVEHGFGLTLDHNYLKEADLHSTIMELITTSKYKKRALRLAQQLSDQPMTGVEKAAWWTEYVLRHKNVDLLKNRNTDLPLYQYYFLDIIFFCLFVILVSFYIVKFVVGKLILVVIYLLSIRNKIKSD